jgi:putrescine transport system permease protein
MIARVLWEEYFNNNDWPMAASVAVTMIALILLPLIVFNRYQSGSAAGHHHADGSEGA